MIASRTAVADDVVGGISPGEVYEPTTIDDAAALIRDSAQHRRALAFVGGGTDLEIGLPPERVDALLRTTRLDRLVEHAPSDQIVIVEAGMTLAKLQEIVGAHRQRLALDPPLRERATIGGIIAANAFGPLRTRYGSVRDLIIGISIVRADGVVARGGGKVVKNVAGFDLPRLMVGSLGTLGFIATATFRLHPLPEVVETVLIRSQSASHVRRLAGELKKGQLEPAAMVAIARKGVFDVLIRFEGFRAGVVEQRDRLFTFACAGAQCELLDASDAQRLWRQHDDARTGGTVRLKIAALPSMIETVCASVMPRLLASLSDNHFIWYPTLGIGFLTGVADSDAEVATAIRAGREVLHRDHNASLTIHAAPAGVRHMVDVWGDPPGGIALMREMKLRFDPDRRLAPGRFVGGI